MKHIYDVDKILSDVEGLFKDFLLNADRYVAKFNKSAGRRSRKAARALEKQLKVWRKTIIQDEKGIKED